MRALMLIAAASIAIASPAFAEEVDCKRIMNLTPDEAQKESRNDYVACANRGWEPGKNLRARSGVVPGRGFTITNTQAPSDTPRKVGAPPSVPKEKIKASFTFPPWKGFPCSLPGGKNLCGNDDNEIAGFDVTTGNPTPANNSSCPVADDTTGTFGARLPLSGSGANLATCGGVVPLSTYPMTLVTSPIGMAATEYNSPYLWVYRNAGGGYTSDATPLPLPTYLCKPTGTGGAMEKSIELKAPIGQFVTYNAASQTIGIRLINATATAEEASDPLAHRADEKYLIVPIKMGVPEPPANCADETTYYKTGASGDITIEANLNPPCEGTAEECAKAGTPTVPTASASCETATLNPSGTTHTASGDVVCDGKTLMLTLDRPNLVQPPGTTEAHYAISGRTAVMALTTNGSQLYSSSDTIIRLNRSDKTYIFNEGGTLGVGNDQRLIMYGPTTINMAGGTITLTNGGELRNTAGNTLASYKSGTSFTVPGGPPYVMLLGRSVELPAGYHLPTQPSPYMRGPIGKADDSAATDDDGK